MTFQLGAGLLDACVLAVLARGDAYGYNLTQQVKSVIDISESTLYPVLRRLQKENCLTTYEQQYEGRNRRYYRITDPGREKLGEYLWSWSEYKMKIDNILTGEGGVNQ